jgi:hypothetical protein
VISRLFFRAPRELLVRTQLPFLPLIPRPTTRPLSLEPGHIEPYVSHKLGRALIQKHSGHGMIIIEASACLLPSIKYLRISNLWPNHT